ncbi:MAG: hypothetical protein ACYCW6_12955, partial [Candidatus Xenobia bacterium]
MAIQPLEAVGSRGLGGGLTPAGTARGTGNAGTGAPGDGTALSQEAKELQGAAVDAELMAGAGDVEQAKGGGNPQQLNQLKDTLANSFVSALGEGLPISEGTQTAVHHALEDGQQGQGQQGQQPPAGNANGGPPVSGGGSGGGPAPVGGGGGPAPIGGGGGPAPIGNRGGTFGGGGLAPFAGNGAALNPGQWSSQDQASLNAALNASPGSFNNDLVNGFHQTVEGNCASVGTIKEAMATYGNQVFDNVSQNQNGGYDFTMQDGYRGSLSRDQLALANANSGFAGTDPQARAYATLAYGAMAQRQAQEQGTDFGSAVDSLNHGQDPYHTAHLLGLSNQLRSVDGDSPHMNAWNGMHDVFVDRAHGVTDHYGQATRYNGTDGNASRYGLQNATLRNAFTFAPRSFPSQRYNMPAGQQHSQAVAQALQATRSPSASLARPAGTSPSVSRAQTTHAAPSHATAPSASSAAGGSGGGSAPSAPSAPPPPPPPPTSGGGGGGDSSPPPQSSGGGD